MLGWVSWTPCFSLSPFVPLFCWSTSSSSFLRKSEWDETTLIPSMSKKYPYTICLKNVAKYRITEKIIYPQNFESIALLSFSFQFTVEKSDTKPLFAIFPSPQKIQESTMIRSMDFGTRLFRRLPGQPWTNFSIALHLSFLICEMGWLEVYRS